MRKIAVVAIKEGYIGNLRRRKGAKFQVEESQFSKKWMERLTDRESKEVEEETAEVQEVVKGKGKGKAAEQPDDKSVI